MNAGNFYKILGDKMWAAHSQACRRDRLAKRAEKRADKAFNEKRYNSWRRAAATARAHRKASLGQTQAMLVYCREREFWYAKWVKSLGLSS